MHNLLESFRSAIQAIWAHRMRSFLTALGIIIGVASVIGVVSIVQGLSHSINNQFKGLGTNSVTITSYTPFQERLKGKSAKLTHSDMVRIRHRVEGIRKITPVVQPMGFRGSVQHRSQTTTTQILGTTSSYQDLYEFYPARGRFFTAGDDRTRRRVAVLGPTAVSDLELPDDPVGEFVRIGGEWFRVIGVMEKRGKLLGIDQDDYVLMPYSTGRTLIGNARIPDIQVSFVVEDLERMPVIRDRITRILRREHGLGADDPDDFRIQTADQLVESVTSITDMVTLVLGGVVGISLLVGGVGIMNIMLVSVTERTREIGICKALGAQRRDILMQFLIEAVTLSLLGGLVGLGVGYLLGTGVASLIPGLPAAHVPWWSILLSFGFSAAVGVIFGIVPAAKAANLDPIDALRYE